ncbi:MAG: T9SS type A sorting domain-containing protein [Bacteroidia bacterium]|nr:T9SS type A sorting domain-containing protein [Bacteroidia bacterium]
MKSIKIILAAFSLFISTLCFSQARLRITAIDNFPGQFAADSAFAGTPYDSILITIKNTGTLAFQGEVDVFLTAGPGVLDTLFLDSIGGTLLAPSDSVIRRPAPYFFNSVHFDDGDNIVVVWPQARTGGIPSDTTIFHVYFISLQSIAEFDQKQISVSPNPGTDFIRLDLAEINQLEQVRIIDSSGRIFFQSKDHAELISIRNWPAGIYFIEVLGNQSRYSGRLIIQ